MASVGRGFAPSRNDNVGGAPKSATSDSSASSILQSSMRRKISSDYYVCLILLFAVNCFGLSSAQVDNFTVESTSYSCSSNLICLGDAHAPFEGNSSNGIQAGRLSLIWETPELAQQSAGIAYYTEQVRLLDPSTGQSSSFNTSFVVDVVMERYNAWGDGFTFVISADKSTLGVPAKSLGIFNSIGTTNFKSIVVEFDGYQNEDAPVYDISDNHVSFDFSNITWAAAANASDVNVQLAFSRNVHHNLTVYAWVEYSNETQRLEVRVSNNNSRPITALLNYTVDLFQVAEEYMWVGFSAGCGDSYSYYYVGDWTFESYGLSPPKLNASSGSKLGLVVGISVGIPAFLLACTFVVQVFVQRMAGHRDCYMLCRLRWRSLVEEEPMMQIEGMPERFSYSQLSVATGAFSKESKLGQGGFGSVYRGVLPSSGIPVAVKKINGDSTQGEKEFMAEVSIISRLRHRNLIQLLGWCKDKSKEKYLLVYELMPNGSLDKVLFGPVEKGKRCPSWQQRFNIVTGTAAALDYLHQGWKQQVIHRDIKSSNIMLDEDWNAKLGDFGLARLVDHEKTAATTLVAGTYGYIAPEVTASGKFTEKTDVFAFGTVVLEIACGRKALSSYLPSEEMILVDWVWQNLSEGKLLSTVDKRLHDYDTDWMEVILIVGLLCSHPNPLARPSMKHVVQILAGDAPVPSIPASKPTLVFSSDSERYAIADLQSPQAWSNSTFRSGSISRSISLVSTNTSDSARPSTGKTSGSGISSNSNFSISRSHSLK